MPPVSNSPTQRSPAEQQVPAQTQQGAPGTPPAPQSNDMQQPNPAQATPAPATPEPFGAQVLRRVHEDHSLLIQDYDEMIGVLENPRLQQFMVDTLQGIDQMLSAIEQMFSEEYGHLAPLDGAMPIEPAPAMSGEAIGEQAAPVEEETVEEEAVSPEKKPVGKALPRKSDKDVTNSQSDALPANSGMKGSSYCKVCGRANCICPAVAVAPRKKSMCNKCGKSPCSCSSQAVPDFKGLEGKKEDTSLGELLAHEKTCAKEAHQFLSEIANCFDFGEEHRLKSFHFHKVLEGIGNSGQASDSPEAGSEAPAAGMEVKELETGGFSQEVKSSPEDSQFVGGRNWMLEEQGEAAHSLHPHRAKCLSASGFCKALSTERAFGDRHRAEAIAHYENMLDLFSEIKEELDEGDPDNTKEEVEEELDDKTPATEDEDNVENKESDFDATSKEDDEEEEDTKSLKSLFAKQQKMMADLQKELAVFSSI